MDHPRANKTYTYIEKNCRRMRKMRNVTRQNTYIRRSKEENDGTKKKKNEKKKEIYIRIKEDEKEKNIQRRRTEMMM